MALKTTTVQCWAVMIFQAYSEAKSIPFESEEAARAFGQAYVNAFDGHSVFLVDGTVEAIKAEKAAV